MKCISLYSLCRNTEYFYKWFLRFADPENIGVDAKIVILYQLELEIMSKLNFQGGHFFKILGLSFYLVTSLISFPGVPWTNNKMESLIESIVGVHGNKIG